ALLNELVDYDPAAVFYDISFAQARPETDKFATALRTASNNRLTDCRAKPEQLEGLPIFAADDPDAPILKPLCQAGLQAVATGWSGHGYPATGNGGIRTAAFRLFDAWCAKHPSNANCEKRPPDSLSMSVQWGIGVAEGQAKVMSVLSSCEDAS